MKESILDVLLYLFENYISEEPELVDDRDRLRAGLNEAGFAPTHIGRALDWLDALAERRSSSFPAGLPASRPFRIYAPAELDRLDTDCRGFLLFLEANDVIDSDQRELVIDRAMALDSGPLDIDDLKWVVLMVLFNQPGAEGSFAWMENHLFDADAEPLN